MSTLRKVPLTEYAELMNRSRQTIYNWMANGRLRKDVHYEADGCAPPVFFWPAPPFSRPSAAIVPELAVPTTTVAPTPTLPPLPLLEFVGTAALDSVAATGYPEETGRLCAGGSQEATTMPAEAIRLLRTGGMPPIIENEISLEELNDGKDGRVGLRDGSPHLYYYFRYCRVAAVVSSHLSDTPENRRWARRRLDEAIRLRNRGELHFAREFPDATPYLKEKFTKLELERYGARAAASGPLRPEDVKFKEYLPIWRQGDALLQKGKTTKDDERIVKARLKHFDEYTFAQVTEKEVDKFGRGMVYLDGDQAGEPVSRKRAGNVLGVLRKIWRSARRYYEWYDLKDPVEEVIKDLDKSRLRPEDPEAIRVWRFDELMAILSAIDPYYPPVVRSMVLTGIIPSEMRALRHLKNPRQSDITDEFIKVRASEHRRDRQGDETRTNTTKNQYRTRRIRRFASLDAALGELLTRAQGERVFTMKSGIPFDGDNFRNNPWKRALKKAGLAPNDGTPCPSPYSLRHTFAAWCLIAGVHIDRVVALMGHSNREMLYKHYGKYVEGLEADREKIRGFLGADFLTQNLGSPVTDYTAYVGYRDPEPS